MSRLLRRPQTATDDAVRAERLAAHARHVRTHVDQLSSKAYWSLVTPSPEFVIAFVPGEAMLAQALETSPRSSSTPRPRVSCWPAR